MKETGLTDTDRMYLARIFASITWLPDSKEAALYAKHDLAEFPQVQGEHHGTQL